MNPAQNYLDSTRRLYRYYKLMGDKVLERLNDTEIHFQHNQASNSCAIIAKHIAGNMLSRWTDFLHSDGEKDWRNRDTEFEDTFKNKSEVIQYWEKGWNCLFNATDPLQADDLEKIAYIRNEGHTVLEAMNRQLAHYASHVGQMVFLAKTIKGADWESLSIPKGKSKEFNQSKFSQEKTRKNFI